MARGPKIGRRKVAKLGAVGIIAMFAWSLVAAPTSVGQEAEIVEPDALTSYFTFGDASPISGYLDHQVLPAPAFGPAIAHSGSEVALPSEASAIAWLLDAGLANGLHGTTTGASVPTEVTAKQPGGAPTAEFKVAGGPIGEEDFGRLAAGVAGASATHSDSPRGFAHAYVGNMCLFPAAGSPPEPPGTYDPDATFPGGDNQQPVPDPGPQSQQCIVGASSIASTSQSIREGDTVTSIAVAELSGVTIGDRTSDNRCTTCIYIDSIRVEAYARSNGTPGGVRSGYRVMLGRACLRQYRPSTTDNVEAAIEKAANQETEEIKPHEVDRCLGDDEFPPEGDVTIHSVDTDELNAFFADPMVIPDTVCGGVKCTLGIKITAGKPGDTDPLRAQRVASPPEDPCRNYAYPDPNKEAEPYKECTDLGTKTGPDHDQGQEAKAVAEGIDIDILTIFATQLVPKSQQPGDLVDIVDQCFDSVIPDDLRSNEQFGSAYGVVQDNVGCPVPGLRQVRDVNITLGVAQANAVARPNIIVPIPPGGGGGGGILPPVNIPPITGGPGLGGGTGGGGSVQIVGGGGLGAGKYALKIDWSSLKIRPWPAKDLAKALFAGAIIAGMIWLIRRRIRAA